MSTVNANPMDAQPAPQSVGQRALAAARLVHQLAPHARTRQRAGSPCRCAQGEGHRPRRSPVRRQLSLRGTGQVDRNAAVLIQAVEEGKLSLGRREAVPLAADVQCSRSKDHGLAARPRPGHRRRPGGHAAAF